MRINTNMAALNAWRALSVNNERMTKSLEKLSSGYRINRAADDAAGLAVSEKMRAQIRGLNMAIRNAQDGVSMIQTAEGGAQKIQDMLQRMRELAVQAASGTLDAEDRNALHLEYQELIAEIDRIAGATDFNKINLLNVSNPASITVEIQVGPDKDDTIKVEMADLQTGALSFSDGSSTTDVKSTKINSQTDAQAAIQVLDAALESVSSIRAKFGAYQNRLESAIETLRIQSENLTAAESRIRDVDMAQEMATFTKYQILQQASTAMLAQANMSTQSILSLLR